MTPTTQIASCGHCGAALRLEPGADRAECHHCGTTSLVGGGADAPKLRIDPPEDPWPSVHKLRNHARMFLAFAAVATAVTVIDFEAYAPLLLFAGVWVIAGYLNWSKAKAREAEVRELEDFRRRAPAGLGVVEAISAGSSRNARLSLRLELEGQPTRHVEHAATIPELVVPRLVEGLTLPVIAEGDRIEVQWHLV